jgi:hypothetical protein
VVLTELGLKGTISGALPFVFVQDISSSYRIEGIIYFPYRASLPTLGTAS